MFRTFAETVSSIFESLNRYRPGKQVDIGMALWGQRSTALAQYEACRRLLAKELGVEPTSETTALYEKIKVG